ncbi:hypothetical protein LMG26690_04818 [Achromobacter animicus]|uniref:Uncharacterized protein n=1 Tax=Achromobacter animicus TaxID=1389935 RepID=A0A6S7AJZ6_9BURK|nr:hypothetical protein LMG26690_04818 [Achromobacter animicus]
MGADHAVERLRHDVGLPGQRQRPRRIARGLAAGGGVGGQQHAASAAHRAKRVGTQFRAHAAHVAAIVAALVDQVAKIQFAGRLGRLDLHAQLAVAVIEHDLVVAVAAEFLALEAAQRGCVAVLIVAARRAVPRRRVAAGQVGLRAGFAVDGRRVHLGVHRLARLAAGRGRNAALASSVVERAHDQRLIDVFVQESHQHFLPDARHEAHAHARACLALRHARPSAFRQALAVGLPMKAHTHVAARVAMDFVFTAGLGRAVGAGDNGRMDADGGRGPRQPGAACRSGQGAPRAVAAHRAEPVGVADLVRARHHGRLGASHADIGIAVRCLAVVLGLVFKAQEIVQGAQPVRQAGVVLSGKIVHPRVLHAVQRKVRLKPGLA